MTVSPSYAPLRHCGCLMQPRALAATVSDASHSVQADITHRTASVTAVAISDPRARRSPCANRTRSHHLRATQAFVVCVTIRPFGGSGPLGPGPSPCAGLAAGLCLGVAPYPVPRATPRAGATGATKDRGTRKTGVPPVFSRPLRFSFPQHFPVHVRSQAQCLSQAIRSRNEANRLFITELAWHPPTFDQSVLRTACHHRNPHRPNAVPTTALSRRLKTCLCGSWFRCRRQVLAPAFSDLVLILHPHPSITHTAAPARRSKHSVPRPMLTGAGLGLKGRLIGSGL